MHVSACTVIENNRGGGALAENKIEQTNKTNAHGSDVISHSVYIVANFSRQFNFCYCSLLNIQGSRISASGSNNIIVK